MREANDLAAAATEHVAAEHRPGMSESEVAAMWEGHVLAEGGGARARLLAGLVRPRHPHLHRDGRPSRAGERADAARDLGLRRRLLVRPHEERVPRRR